MQHEKKEGLSEAHEANIVKTRRGFAKGDPYGGRTQVRDTPLSRDIGTRLTILRAKKNIKVNELSELLRRAPMTIYRWEKGEARPALDEMIQLSAIYNVSIHYIVTGREWVSC